MSRHSRWLLQELDRWTAEGLVTPDQAAQIRARYRAEAPGAPWGMIAFSGLGAVIVGLGVILLFAYNWDAIPRLVKLALIVATTAGAHGGGLLLRARGGGQSQMGEVLSLLGTMFFGAGIWLVAQIYHIDEHFPNGFLIWGLGALAMAWALASTPQGIVAVVTLCIWGGSEVAGFNAEADASSLLVAAGLGTLAWRQRSGVLMAVVLAGLYVLLTMHAAHHGGAATGYVAAFSLSALAIAAAKLLDRSEESGGVTRVMRFMGTLGFVVCLYLLTFEGATGALLRGAREPDGAWLMAAAYRWLIFALAIGAWGWLLPGAFSREGPRRVSLDEWLCPVTLIVSQVLALTGTTSDKLLGFLLFNLIGFCLASMWMVNGCKSGSLGRTVAGSLLLAALVFARFFDLFESLALRGLVFVVLGAVLFAEGFYYRKLRRESPGKENDQ